MTEIRILVMPYEVGALRAGVGRGPERLLELGAEEALASRGATVSTEVIELEDDLRGRSGASEVNAGFELMGLVSERVRAAIDDGAFPVLLSGSCFAAVGVVAGLGESSPGVVWFDAHGDFNTPESAVDGYFDGMGLAILTGSAWRTLHQAVPGSLTVPETAAILAGARDFDEPELARLESSEVIHVRPEEIDSDATVARATSGMEPQPSGLYVHLDLDVLDVEEAPVNIYSVGGGLTADRLIAQIQSLFESCPVRAFSLTAYDPECDPDDRVSPIANGVLELVAEAVANEPR